MCKHHINDQKHRTKGTSTHPFAVCINDTLDAIDNEKGLLSLNLATSCSVVLIAKFVIHLRKGLQCSPFRPEREDKPYYLTWIKDE